MQVMITGGIRSGKSTYALQLAETHCGPGDRYFLATATPFDEEMKQRIENHKRERNNGFHTIEEPVEIHTAVRDNMILDDITMWLNNLFYRNQQDRWEEILDKLLAALPANIIIVTNEIGLGNIPADKATRYFNRCLGTINKRIAAAVDQVYFMVSGYPLKVK
jgi:adenosylcobinamide kinase/adenosylcobinamide-phosphate guanylyltransferase